MKYCAFILLFVANTAQAQDVYNFYFQKNQPARNNVTEKALEVSAPRPVSQAAVVKPKEEKKVELKHFEFGVSKGYTRVMIDDRVTGYDDLIEAEGVGLQGAYRFNKYFAVDGALNITEIDSVNYDEERSRLIDASLGVAVTPIHITLFGVELIEFSALAGVMSGTQGIVNRDDTLEMERVYGAHIGLRLGINLTSQLALVAGGTRMVSSDRDYISLSQAGLRYRF
jgi:hypothetical protein